MTISQFFVDDITRTTTIFSQDESVSWKFDFEVHWEANDVLICCRITEISLDF